MNHNVNISYVGYLIWDPPKGVVTHGLRTAAPDPANMAININHLTWTLQALL